MTAHEDRFREALVEYLRAEDMLSDKTLVNHFMVIATGVRMEDRDYTSTICAPSDNFPFAYQMGVMEYCLAHHRHRVNCDNDED